MRTAGCCSVISSSSTTRAISGSSAAPTTIIIRGGKNLSAAAIEENVADHPAVALAAAIGFPDPVFGERAAAYVELRPGETLDFDALKRHLTSKGVMREIWPEALVVLDALPQSVGGKVAKQKLREDALKRFESGASSDAEAHAAAARRRPDPE